MSAFDPFKVTTSDGAVWVRAAVSRAGRGLYSLEGLEFCPPFVMATLDELAVHGVKVVNDLATAIDAMGGALPVPVRTAHAVMTPEQRKAIVVQIGEAKSATDALIGSFAESVANVRNHEHPSWEDLYCMNLISYMGERMGPVLRRLLDAEDEVARLRARVAELEAQAGTSPWERAVIGLNALADAGVAFWIEPDGHISGPFGDEHIEWDQAASRWRLVHDDEDDVHPPHPAPCRVPNSPDCACPPAPGALAEQRHFVDELDHVLEHLADGAL